MVSGYPVNRDRLCAKGLPAICRITENRSRAFHFFRHYIGCPYKDNFASVWTWRIGSARLVVVEKGFDYCSQYCIVRMDRTYLLLSKRMLEESYLFLFVPMF